MGISQNVENKNCVKDAFKKHEILKLLATGIS
jgi:hypothetical protein